MTVVSKKLKIARQEWVQKGNRTPIPIASLQPPAIEVNRAGERV